MDIRLDKVCVVHLAQHILRHELREKVKHLVFFQAFGQQGLLLIIVEGLLDIAWDQPFVPADEKLVPIQI